MKISKVLATTDFSELSDAAVDQAAALSKQLDAELVLLHVCPLLVYALDPDVVPDDPDFEQKLKARLGERLEARAGALRESGCSVRTLLVDGSPGQKIAEVAQNEGANLIVMGTHGRTGLGRVALGSVAERTVRLSRVPVMTIPS